MKKIINNKVYDTDKAQRLGIWSNNWNGRDFDTIDETLYVKRTGEYFLHGDGGPMTHYAVQDGPNNWRGGQKIIPMTAKQARAWAEEHLTGEEYEKIFGLPDEDAEDAVLNITLPARLMASLRAEASDKGTSLADLVRSILADHQKE